MKNYIVYDKVTGKITRTGYCTDRDFYLQGEFVIEGVADDILQYVQDGVVVNTPDRPSQYHVFDYATKQWIDPRTPETEWPLVRAERDQRLLASDWTQLPDVPIATKEAWAVYRQALRDITEQPDPFNIVWPVPPQ